MRSRCPVSGFPPWGVPQVGSGVRAYPPGPERTQRGNGRRPTRMSEKLTGNGVISGGEFRGDREQCKLREKSRPEKFADFAGRFERSNRFAAATAFGLNGDVLSFAP